MYLYMLLTFYQKLLIIVYTSLFFWATDWTIGVLGFDSRPRLGIFLFTTVTRTALDKN